MGHFHIRPVVSFISASSTDGFLPAAATSSLEELADHHQTASEWELLFYLHVLPLATSERLWGINDHLYSLDNSIFH